MHAAGVSPPPHRWAAESVPAAAILLISASAAFTSAAYDPVIAAPRSGPEKRSSRELSRASAPLVLPLEDATDDEPEGMSGSGFSDENRSFGCSFSCHGIKFNHRARRIVRASLRRGDVGGLWRITSTVGGYVCAGGGRGTRNVRASESVAVRYCANEHTQRAGDGWAQFLADKQLPRVQIYTYCA